MKLLNVEPPMDPHNLIPHNSFRLTYIRRYIQNRRGVPDSRAPWGVYKNSGALDLFVGGRQASDLPSSGIDGATAAPFLLRVFADTAKP